MITLKKLKTNKFFELRSLIVSIAAKERLTNLRLASKASYYTEETDTVYLIVDDIIDPASHGYEMDSFSEEASELFNGKLRIETFSYEGIKAQYQMASHDSEISDARYILRSAIDIATLDQETALEVQFQTHVMTPPFLHTLPC